MKDKFQSKAVPRGTRTIWRYLGALFLLFTFAIGNVWAATESACDVLPGTSDVTINGTSYSIASTYIAGSGSKNGQMSCAGIKFRNNREASITGVTETTNLIPFIIKEGYKITGIQLVGHANDNTKTCTVGKIYIDGVAYAGFTATTFPNKKASTSANVSITNITATRDIVLWFSDVTKNQVNIEYTITYEETSSCTAPTDPEIAGVADYTAGDNISLTASATGTDGSTTYTWYKGKDWATASAGSSIGSAATLTINDCAESDDGTYWCNISNGTGCEVQVSKAITVAPASCTDVVAPTGLAEDEEARTTEAITFTWTAADHASSYDVKLWDNAGCTGDPIASANVTGTSKQFTGLTDETTYYCKVQSKGDGETYCTNGGTTVAVSGTTKALPSYDVTVATSTGDDTRGTVSAAAASVKEGSTTTITAVPAPGYRVANWAISGEGASISPSGSSNSKTTTLTMGSENATVTVTFEEIPCPTSGVLYTMTMKSKSLSSVNQHAEVALVAGDYATEEGGVSYLGNNNSDASKAQIKTEAGGIVYFNGNDAYLKVALDCPLQPGDFITIEGNASSTTNVYIITNTNSRTSEVTSTNTSGTKKYYTVVADDALDGKSAIYFWRAASSANKNIHSVTITRPYAVTFESAHGTAPTTPTKALSFTLTELSDEDYDHTGWTADKAVKVGGETKAVGSALAVDATVELTDNTTFTATWAAKAPTFAVTYKANNGTSEADIYDPAASTFAANTFTVPDGKMFAGWNTQADGEGTNYAVGDAVTAAITVYAKWVVDPTIRLIKNDGTLNTVNFVTGGTLKDDGPFTVEAVEYAKNVQFGNSCSGVSSIDNLNKAVIYHSTTNATKVTIVAYNNYTGGSTANLLYAVVPEGTTTASAITKTLNKSTGGVYEVNMTGRSTLYIYAGHKEVRICQVSVEENGTANAVAPAVGYSVNLNKQRPFLTSGAVTEFEGIEYKVSSNYKPLNGQVQIQTLETNYISFEIPEGETRQLQLTTSNTNKYTVSKTLGDNTESQKVSGNQNINLTEGVWYINPQGSNVNITNIAFGETPDPLTVTFKDGESTLSEQALFVGDKVAEPEAPTKTGYRFDKWQKSGVDYDFDYTLVAGDAPGFTLDAVWQKTWNVTFDADNGSDPVVVTVDNNQAVAQPVNPEKSGFDFVEWQLSGSAYDFATLVTDNIILKATWEVAQDDATLSALSYDGNAIDVASAEDVSGVQTYTYHLPWGSTIDPALVSVTKSAETATVGSLVYDSENKRISFAVESGNHTVLINYAIQFVIDAKRGTSIIKATTNNVITGIIGGTRDTNLGNGDTKKLNSNTYFGVTLANDETFQEGDVFIVNITTPADLGKFMIYADKDRNELIADQGIVYTKPDVADPVICPTGEMMMTLPAAANGKKSLYLSRENGTTQWNPVFSYIEVTREMNPAIKSFKFGDDAATINESAKTISIEVPYATDVTALTPTVEAYGNNGATYTPAGVTNFTSPVVYTVTDGYNELHTDYTVTVNIAAPSTNAYLASLSVAGYTLDFNKEVEDYNIVLDYGTTVLPEITYAVEDAGLATAVKVENGVNGATTITVTPQAGAGYEKVYTINFSVSTTPKFVIYDGQKSAPMAEIATSGSDVSTGFAWTITGASNTEASGKELSFEGKTYSKYVNLFTSATKAPGAGDARYITITIPDGYVAKFRLVGCGNGDKSRSSYISKEITGTLDQSIVYATTTANNVLDGRSSALQLPGTYYYCADNSIRLYELSVQLYPIDETRDVTEGRFGTICYPNGGFVVGATVYEVAYYGETSKKIFFDEILGGAIEGGIPYVFLPKAGVSQIAITYADAVDAAAGSRNGLVGSYVEDNVPVGKYILSNNQYWYVDVLGSAKVLPNRAYIDLDAISPSEPALAPGRHRVSMGVNGKDAAQGFENIESGDAPMKVMIDGTLYIIRGEKVFDATGRLVK